MSNDDLVTLREAAKRTGLNRATITKRVDSGVLESFELPANPRLRLVRLADVQALQIPKLRTRKGEVVGAAA